MSEPTITVNHCRAKAKTRVLDAEVSLYGPNCRGRDELEHFIAAKYRQIHSAELNEYLPLLLGVHDRGRPVCAAGFRPGLYRPMFLEQYLDAPIEQQVATLSRQPVDRCSLVEIGNLAVACEGYGPFIMTVMTASLAEAGYEWMVFTVTAQVERLIRRLGFKPYYLAGADADRLEGDKSHWGSYYENNPRVMVGNIKTAMDIIADNTFLSAMVTRQRDCIVQMACSLQDYRRQKEQ